MNKKGFTLIEILIALLIIGILTTVATIAIVTRQKQARDSRRLQDLNTITKAIEYYQIDNNKLPGEADDFGYQLSAQCGDPDPNVNHNMYDDLVTNGKYLTEMPSDPLAYNKCQAVDLKDTVANIDDKFFYAWDSAHNGGKCECIAINRFESAWMIQQLNALYPHSDGNLLDIEVGGDANIGTERGDGYAFNWCYVHYTGATCP